jgi:hypothetical protein
MHKKIWSEKLKRRYYLGDVNADTAIILKRILKKQDVRMWA